MAGEICPLCEGRGYHPEDLVEITPGNKELQVCPACHGEKVLRDCVNEAAIAIHTVNFQLKYAINFQSENVDPDNKETHSTSIFLLANLNKLLHRAIYAIHLRKLEPKLIAARLGLSEEVVFNSIYSTKQQIVKDLEEDEINGLTYLADK